MKSRKIKRGSLRKHEAVFVGVWVPAGVVGAIDNAVREQDLDRSKYMRRAIEEKIRRESAPAAA